MVGNEVGVFGLDLGVRGDSVQELGELVVEVDFVLARHRQRECFSFLRPQFQEKKKRVVFLLKLVLQTFSIVFRFCFCWR